MPDQAQRCLVEGASLVAKQKILPANTALQRVSQDGPAGFEADDRLSLQSVFRLANS